MKFSDFTKNFTNGINTAKMLKQANDMKNKVLKIKKECENKQYTEENKNFKIIVRGDYKIIDLQIKKDNNCNEDLNTLQISLIDTLNNIFITIKKDQNNSIKKITGDIDLSKLL